MTVEAADDVEVVAAMAAGDGDALAELYRRYGGRRVGGGPAGVRRPHAGRGRDPDRVRRPVAPPAALRSRPRVRSGPWLVAQAHARAVDTVRSEAARQRRQEREVRLAPPPVARGRGRGAPGRAVRGRAPGGGPAAPTTSAEAIVLAYFGGHSYRETAELLGEPEGTVKSRIRRGLTGLRRALESEGLTS